MFKVCRTCLQKIYDSNYFTLANNTVTAVIRNELSLCIPEMNVDVVAEPVMCCSCVTALHAAFNFKYRCLQTEEQIRAYLESHSSFISNLDLYDMFSDVCENVIECTDIIPVSDNFNKANSDIPILINESTINIEICESSSENNEMPTLEMIDEYEENQIKFNSIFNEVSIRESDANTRIDVESRLNYTYTNEIIPEAVEPILNCNLDQWANFEKNYLNVYDLENLNKLVCGYKKGCKRKKRVLKEPKQKLYKRIVKECSVVLNRCNIKPYKKKTIKDIRKSRNISNRINDKTIKNVLKKKPLANSTNKKEYSKTKDKKKTYTILKNDSRLLLKCKSCKYTTDIEIDMELHAITHVTLDKCNEWDKDEDTLLTNGIVQKYNLYMKRKMTKK